MKKILKKVISLFLVMVMVFGAAPLSGFVGLELPEFGSLFAPKAEATTYNGTCGENVTWTLDTDSGELIISGTGEMWDIYCSHWYDYFAEIEKVTILNGLPSIGGSAFYDCYSLTSLTIPDSVTRIGCAAFTNCNNLTSIIIPDSITRIEDIAFLGCENLTDVYYTGTKEQWDSIIIGSENDCLTNATIHYNSSGDIYSGTCGKNVTWSIDNNGVLTISGTGEMENLKLPNNYPWDSYASSITSVVIEDGVTSIGDSAFSTCRNITSVTIGKGLTSISELAFGYCSKLTNITIPDNITNICDFAFYNCGNLAMVEIGSGVRAIEDSAFLDCTVADIYYNGTEEDWNNITIEDFNDCLSDATIHFNTNDAELYTITWKVNGGEWDSGSTSDIVQYYEAGENINWYSIPAPIKEGYCFMGWVDENGDMALIPSTMPAADIILTALWEPINQGKYTIDFYVNGVLYDSHSYAEGENILYPPNPVMVGYIFCGWDLFLSTMPAEDVCVHALWAVNDYIVSFDANGGQWSDGSTTKQFEVEYGSPIVAPDEDPMREGFIFCGWADKYGNGEIISDFGNMEFGAEYEAVWLQDLSFCSVQDVRRLTDNVFSEARALYEIRVMYRPEKIEFLNSADTSVVVLNRNEPFVKNDLKTSGVVLIRSYDIAGNEISSSSPDIEYEIWNVVVSLTEGEYKVRTNYKNDNVSWESIGFAYRFCMQYDFPPVSEDSFYKIEKYRMDTSGEYSLISSETVKTNASHVSVTPELIDGFTVSSDSVLSATVQSDGSTTLKVYYARNIYSVKFYDGENLLSNSNYYYDSIIAEPVPPVKQGYKLAGWSKDGKTVSSDLGNVPASDIVFYAVFEEAKFNVTFDANGGDGVPENLINQSEGTLTLPSAKPSKPGSVFVGWSTDPMGSKPEYQAGDKVELAEDIKFYAVYTEVTEFNGNHYAVLDLSMTWDEAKAYCESLGGHLMTITTQSEQDFAETLISERKMNCYWLGGYEEPEGNWKWVTGETFSYMNWGPGEPNNEGNGEECIEIYAKHDTDNAPGHWNDLAKEGGNGFYKLSSTGFICEWDIEKTEFNGHEYSVIDKSMTWYEAKAYCESLGGHLIAVTSAEEDQFAFELIQSGTKKFYWLGATDEKVEGDWKWVTGESWTYNDWSGYFDNGHNGTEDYVALLRINSWGSAGQWNDFTDMGSSDSVSDFGFICEWDIEKSNDEYIAMWIVDGRMIQFLTVSEGIAITSPENPKKDGYKFIGWTPEVPETMPAQHMTFVAVWEKVGSSEEPDTPSGSDEYETVVGVLQEYETTVNLNGGTNWISKGCIDGQWYNLYEDYTYQERIENYEDKQVVAVIYNGYVSTIELLSELETDPRIYNFDSSIPTLEYYDGVFRKYDGSSADKWHTANGTISNPLANDLIDASKIPASEFLKFKNVTVTIKSSDKSIISLDNGFWDIESDSMTIEIGDIGAGESINISERVLKLKTKWNFPKDKKEHRVTLYYTVAGTVNGETITKEFTETIQLVNRDYVDHVTEPISRKQTVDEFLKEMEYSINNCYIISNGEKVYILTNSEVASMTITLNLIGGFLREKTNAMTTEEVVSHLSDFIDTGVNSIDEFCELVIDNISKKIGKEEEKLEEELWVAIGSTVDSEAWGKFFKWHHDQQGVYKNSLKRTDARCPVDVYVFDKNGKTVLSIVGNVITQSNEDIHAFVCKDDKIIYLPTDTDYDIKIIATGNGTMDYVVTEYCSENKLRETVYENLLLTVGEQYSGVVIRSTMPEADSYNLTSSDGTEFAYDYIRYNETVNMQADICPPSTTTVNYGDSIVLHADLSETLPSGWKVEWTASNGNFSYTVSDDSATCTITPNKSGSTTFTVTVYDENGNAVSSDEQTMTSKAGFFDKIIAFFKKLFGLTKVIPQALKYIY